MTEVAKRKLKGYSLGMKQRLGLAGALLGDPDTIILDEPANGLDPEGIRWIRDFLRHLAAGPQRARQQPPAGEMSLLAQDLVVIGRGRLISQGPVDDFVDRHATAWVRVRTPDPALIAEVLRARAAPRSSRLGAGRDRGPRPADRAGRRDGAAGRRDAARTVAQN